MHVVVCTVYVLFVHQTEPFSVWVCDSKQDMIEILKDYGKQNVTIKSVARVLGESTDSATLATSLTAGVPAVQVRWPLLSLDCPRVYLSWYDNTTS